MPELVMCPACHEWADTTDCPHCGFSPSPDHSPQRPASTQSEPHPGPYTRDGQRFTDSDPDDRTDVYVFADASDGRIDTLTYFRGQWHETGSAWPGHDGYPYAVANAARAQD